MQKNYTLGRGKVYFDAFAPGTRTITGERYLGNTPEFGFAISAENLDHFDSDEGLRVKDDSVLLQLDRTASFTTDNIAPKNLALWFLGSESALVQASQTGQTSTLVGVQKGLFYQIGRTTSNPAGARAITSVTVTDNATPTPNNIPAANNYTVDLALGRIFIHEDAAAITNGMTLIVTYNVSASTRSRIVTAQNATLEGAMRFIAANPKGAQFDYFMPYVRLTPTGDFALKTDEWQVIGFDVEVLKLDATTEAIYVDGRAVVTP